MNVAAELPVEKRSLLLEQIIAARLRLVGPHFNNRDVAAVRAGLHNLAARNVRIWSQADMPGQAE